MRRNLQEVLLAASLAGPLVSCGSISTKKTEAPSPPASVGDASPSPEATALDQATSINLGSFLAEATLAATSAMAYENGSIKGGGPLPTPTPGTVIQGTPVPVAEFADLGCSENGEPISPNDSLNSVQPPPVYTPAPDEEAPAPLKKHMPNSHIDYAAGRFFCLLKANTDDIRTTVGSVSRIQQWGCLLGEVSFSKLAQAKAVAFDQADASCLTSTVKTELTRRAAKELTFQYTVAKIEDNKDTEWQANVSLEVYADKTLIDAGSLLLMKKAGVSAFALKSESGTPAREYAAVFTLDKAAGILRHELYIPGKIKAALPTSFTHRRLLVKGTLNDKGEFSALSSYEGLESSLTRDANGNGNGALRSVKGSPDGGFKVLDYRVACNSAPGCALSASAWLRLGTTSNNQTLSEKCYGSLTTCAGNSGIKLASDADLAFLLYEEAPQSSPMVPEWYLAVKPLTFTEVITSAMP